VGHPQLPEGSPADAGLCGPGPRHTAVRCRANELQRANDWVAVVPVESCSDIVNRWRGQIHEAVIVVTPRATARNAVMDGLPVVWLNVPSPLL
jgi:hypothetical protein